MKKHWLAVYLFALLQSEKLAEPVAAHNVVEENTARNRACKPRLVCQSPLSGALILVENDDGLCSPA
jgi:hypothetical protein